MTSDEGMMSAARVMRDAADTNHRAADRIEESVRQMQMLFDTGYGGTAPRLLEELEKANIHEGVYFMEGGEVPVELADSPILAEYSKSGAKVPYVEWLEAKLEELVPECMKTWKEGL